MIENTIFARNREGKKANVFSLTAPSLDAIEIAARAHFDAVFLDGEHVAFDQGNIDGLVALSHAHGMSVIARVPNLRFDTLTQWLDRGIQGIMAPHVETGKEAQSIVDACYFPPLGHRSWGTHRGTLFNDDFEVEKRFGSRRKFMDFADQNMWVYAQVESQKGYDNLDDILAVEGLHAIAYGPFDLAISLGHSGEGAGHPEIDRVQTDIEKRTRAAGKRLNSDYINLFGLTSVLMQQARNFVQAHNNDPF